MTETSADVANSDAWKIKMYGMVMAMTKEKKMTIFSDDDDDDDDGRRRRL